MRTQRPGNKTPRFSSLSRVFLVKTRLKSGRVMHSNFRGKLQRAARAVQGASVQVSDLVSCFVCFIVLAQVGELERRAFLFSNLPSKSLLVKSLLHNSSYTTNLCLNFHSLVLRRLRKLPNLTTMDPAATSSSETNEAIQQT